MRCIYVAFVVVLFTRQLAGRVLPTAVPRMYSGIRGLKHKRLALWPYDLSAVKFKQRNITLCSVSHFLCNCQLAWDRLVGSYYVQGGMVKHFCVILGCMLRSVLFVIQQGQLGDVQRGIYKRS
jgi:hypothetical protein